MIKTHIKSRIIQFHHNSRSAEKLLSENDDNDWIVLQIEPIEHQKYDFIAEIVKKEYYESVNA